MGLTVRDWSCAVEFTNFGGGVHWGIDNYRSFNYLSDFAEKWLKGVYNSEDQVMNAYDIRFSVGWALIILVNGTAFAIPRLQSSTISSWKI